MCLKVTPKRCEVSVSSTFVVHFGVEEERALNLMCQKLCTRTPAERADCGGCFGVISSIESSCF